MKAIVAACSDWGIGYKGKLLVSNKADMRHFVRHTTGGTVIMGHATLDSFPGGQPLPHRRNIVLSRTQSFERSGVEVAHSIEEVLQLVSTDAADTVWVIGGSSIYQQLLPSCSEALVTKNHCLCPADSFFPNLDEDAQWQLIEEVDGGVTDAGIAFSFARYLRV